MSVRGSSSPGRHSRHAASPTRDRSSGDVEAVEYGSVSGIDVTGVHLGVDQPSPLRRRVPDLGDLVVDGEAGEEVAHEADA
jgi:hypothetical protein